MTDPQDPRVTELARLPSEREGRRTRAIRAALLLSLLFHVLAFTVVVMVARRVPLPDALRPDTPPPFESMNVEFTDQRVAIPEPVAPETNVISDENAIARSPGPDEPVPQGRTSMPDPTLGRRGPPAAPEDAAVEPVEPVEPEPSEADVAALPGTESVEDKRRRVAEALGSLGGRGGDGGSGDWLGTPSSGLSYSVGGGGSMQIESRSDVDWGPWARRVQAKVKENWHSIMPVAARVAMKGIVVVRFRVQRDGTITDYLGVESSGVPPLDRAVDDALLVMSSPLPPPPIPEDSDEESIGITYTFIYNLDDEREMRAWRRMNWQRQRGQAGGSEEGREAERPAGG